MDLDVHKGEVVGLIGDNGAGKSTLVNILSGALQPNAGTILLDGQPVTFASSLEARRAGIETVYQDLSLAPDLSVWENIFLGREKTVKGPLRYMGWLDRRSMIREAEADLDRTHIRIGSVNSLAGRLSGGQRQAIAVGRAVSWGSRVLLMDEPTAALGVEQQETVGELIRSVSSQGVPDPPDHPQPPPGAQACRQGGGAVPRACGGRPSLFGGDRGRHGELDHRRGIGNGTPCRLEGRGRETGRGSCRLGCRPR